MLGLSMVRSGWLGWSRWLVVGAGYTVVLVLIGDLAFGTSGLLVQDPGGPARTGAYNSPLPIVTPVDPGTIARAITESTGGPPTIGLPLPDAQAAVAASPAVTLAGISATSSPTYTAVARTSTTPYWSTLVSLIPTNLKFPPRASPHRR